MRYCRPNLRRTIEELRPKVIIPLGGPAVYSVVSLAWKDVEMEAARGKKGRKEQATKWAGWQIPSQKLNAWICPTYHPSFVLREQSQALELHVSRHLRTAFELDDLPWPKGAPDFGKRCRVIMSPSEATAAIRKYTEAGKPVAVDLETTTLKPDSSSAQILCCSVSDGVTSIGFPWLGNTIIAMSELLKSDVGKIGANFQFEERWFWANLGHGARNWIWDTVVGAHVLDCRSGICSLKFQAFVLLGQPDYSSHLDPFIAGEHPNSSNRLKEVEPFVLYRYCAMDSLLECLVAEKQMGV